MKGKHLLLHHYRRAFAIAAVALAIAGAAQAQTNIISPDTKATQGVASTTTAVDWSYQTLQASIDISDGLYTGFNLFNFGTSGDTRESGKAVTANGVVIHFYYFPKESKLDVRFATHDSDETDHITGYSLSSHGNILNIAYNKTSGLTITDGNGSTVKTYAYSDKSTYFDKLTTTLEVSANNNSTATYKYVRLKGITVASTPDNLGLYAVTGWTDTADDINNALADATKPAFDLTALTCPFTVTPANKNAIVVVGGTINQTGAATAYRSWGDTPNLVVINDNKDRMSAVNQINLIDDANYYPVYTGHMIITYSGYTYTRTVKILSDGYKWFSMCLPMDLTEVPEGVTVWAFNALTTKGTTAHFNNTSHPKAHTPYFAMATKDVTISINSRNTLLDLTAPTSISAGDFTLHGNYGVVACDGKQYALYNSKSYKDNKMPEFFRFDTTSTIDAFRAYFTKNSENASDDLSTYTLSFDDDATAIRNISTENAADADIYTIDGRRTGTTSLQTLPHGLYIQGGKKVVVK